jgi:hypothetical protein
MADPDTGFEWVTMDMHALLILLLLAGNPAVGSPWPSSDPGFVSVRSPARGGISMNRAADMAKRAVGGGRVLSAEATDQGGRVVYRIKVLTRGGEVRYVYVDAESGDVSE